MNKITQNSFGDGLNMDQNALVTPNSVMTNCLNGTLLTFNSNDNVLQNDMGNGKVHNAYLPSGWVPVGMKEYGGIIYVAAYNPELKQSQIGSFPSPQQNYENNKNGGGQTFKLEEGKYKLFTGDNKDMELKPGNKIAICLASETDYIDYSVIQPNYNANENEHLKRWSANLCLLTNSGILTNVTNNLNFLDDSNCLEYNQKYENYFFVNNFTEDLQSYLRIYGGNLVGSPYIQVIENLAQSMDIQILTSKSDNKVSFTIIGSLLSNSQLYGYQNGDTLEEGLAGLQCIIKSKEKEEVFYIEKNSNITTYSNLTNNQVQSRYNTLKNLGIPDSCIHVTNNSVSQLSNYQITEGESNSYSFYIVDTIEVDYSDTLEITINPLYIWNGEYSYQKTLEYNQEFDVAKIGTGIHTINQWRYYYTDNWITLTWGLESYPKAGESIKFFRMKFLDYKGNPIDINGSTELEFDYISFNGEFNYLLESNLFSYKYPYIVEITWMVNMKEFKEYRWILPTKLYNELYTKLDCQDFGSDIKHKESGKSALDYIKELNRIPLNIPNIKNGPVQTVEEDQSDIYEALSQTQPNRTFITRTNKYQYIISSPQVDSKFKFEKDYPFILKYDGSQSEVTDAQLSIENLPELVSNTLNIDQLSYASQINKKDNSQIESNLSIYHPVHYDLIPAPIIEQLYDSYYEDGVDLPNSDVLLCVRARMQTSTGHSDPISVEAATYTLDHKNKNAKREEYNIIFNDTTSLDFREVYLSEYWSYVENMLNRASKLFTKNPQCIPILFYGSAYLVDEQKTMVGGDFESTAHVYYYFNWAVKNSEGNWALYLSTSIPGYIKLNSGFALQDVTNQDYINIKSILNSIWSLNNSEYTKGLINTAFSKNCMHYYRLAKTNFYLNQNMWVIRNNSFCKIIDDSLSYISKITVKGTIPASLVTYIKDEEYLYNKLIDDIINLIGCSELEQYLKFEFDGEYKNNIIQNLEQTFEYEEQFPSNVDLYNAIERSDTSVKCMVKFKNNYYYYNEGDLEGTQVYKLTQINPIKFEEVSDTMNCKWGTNQYNITSVSEGLNTDQRVGDTDSESSNSSWFGAAVGVILGMAVPGGIISGAALGYLSGRVFGDTENDRFDMSLRDIQTLNGNLVFGLESWNV